MSKECDEKSKMMKEAIAEKEAKSDEISEDITSQIDKQVEQITKLIEIY